MQTFLKKITHLLTEIVNNKPPSDYRSYFKMLRNTILTEVSNLIYEFII